MNKRTSNGFPINKEQNIFNSINLSFNYKDKIKNSLSQLHKNLNSKIESKKSSLDEFKIKFIEYFDFIEMYIEEGKKRLEKYIDSIYDNDFNYLNNKQILNNNGK